MGYWISPGATGDGSSSSNPAGSFPSTGSVSNNTVYYIEGNKTLITTSAITISNRYNVTITNYGTGYPTITSDASRVLLYITGNSTGLTLSNLILDSKGNNHSVATASNTANIKIDNVYSKHPLNSTSYHISFSGLYNYNNVNISNSSFDGGYRSIVCFCSIANNKNENISISNVTITNVYNQAIRITVEPTNNAWWTSVFNNIYISDVYINNSAGGLKVQSCSGDLDNWNQPVSGNNITVVDCVFTNGKMSIENDAEGGIVVTGMHNAYIANNTLINVATQGAMISLVSCNNALVERNYCADAFATNRSPSHGNLYIDACGFFADRGVQNSVFRYNTTVNCFGRNRENNVQLMATDAGGGIGIWSSGYNKFYGNLCKNSGMGFFYGDVRETNNEIFNNIDIDSSNSSIFKHGVSTLAGNVKYMNNLAINTSNMLFYSKNACCDLITNYLAANANVAGVVLDSDGIPLRITYDPKKTQMGIDLDGTYYDKNGIPFYSPPNIGAFSTVKGIGDPMTGSIGAAQCIGAMRKLQSSSLATPTYISDTQWWQQFDHNQAGYKFPDCFKTMFGPSVDSDFQMLHNQSGAAPDLANLESLMKNTIVQTIMPDGSTDNVIRSQIFSANSNISSPPQTPFRVQNTVVSEYPNINEMFISVDIKLQSDLESVMSGTYSQNKYWVSLSEFKAGGYGGNHLAGDYRVTVLIEVPSGGGSLYFKVTGDNKADNSPVPGVTGSPQTFWQKYSDVPVPLGTWFKLMHYFKRPVNNADITSGITWVGIAKYSNGILDTIQTLHTQIGGVQKGIYDLELIRINCPAPYTFLAVPLDYHWCNWEMWNKPPIVLPFM